MVRELEKAENKAPFEEEERRRKEAVDRKADEEGHVG